MEKTSKVTSVKFKDEFNSQYGILYNFNIEFENGDKAGYASKTKEQKKFVEGQETKYEIFDKNGFMKCKPVQEIVNTGNAYGRKSDPEADKFRQTLILAQSSMTKACDMASHKVIEYKEIQAACDKLMQQQLDLAHKYKDYAPI